MEPALPHFSLPAPPDGCGLAATVAGLGSGLAEYLRAQRWFGSKGRTVAGVSVADSAALPAEVPAALLLVEVAFTAGEPELYSLPVAARPATAARALAETPGVALARLTAPDQEWLLYDGIADPAVGEALLRQFEDAARLPAAMGAFGFERTPVLSQITDGTNRMPLARVRRIGSEQSNSSVVFDDRLILKLFRRLHVGDNPELEISRFLTFRTRFRNAPLLAGFIRHLAPSGERTVGVLQTFVPGAADGWTWTLGALRVFYGDVGAHPLGRAGEPAPAAVVGLAGSYLASVRRLGEVTGELHAALASDAGDPAFAPEPVTPEDLAAWQAAVETEVTRGLAGLRAAGRAAGTDHGPTIERLLRAADAVHARVADAIGRLGEVPLWKTRVHGDYHLGQVLRVAGEADDFVVLDFEGEPARPLAARRAKQSPLRDVAGMLRSFTYASYAGLFEAAGDDREARRLLEPWQAAWERAVADSYLEGYLGATVERGLVLIPARRDVVGLALSVFCLERAAYELNYELNNRPSWLPIPLAALERELAA
jgi:maltose alpha-D-glucosyltransferase/alpha-amylase